MSHNVANCQKSASRARELLQNALVDPLPTNAALILSLTAMFTVSDAFETGALGLVHSASLWLLVSLLMVVQTCVSHRLFLSLFSKTRFSQCVAIGLALSATVLLMTVELHWLKFTPLLPKQPDPFFEFILFVAQPVLAAGGLTLVAHSAVTQRFLEQLRQREQQLASVPCEESAEAEEREAGELETVLASQGVLRVSAQDHYLEILCEDRRYLLRGRMRDALSLLTRHEGVQLHRSHWVAQQHIAKIVQQGRDTRVLLNDGGELPVARSRAQAVKRVKGG